MGFNVTALAQKARTQTLIVDSDLDMRQYDVIATDVKGDTAEFSEFVGGVGNFESGLISGGLDVSGILHAEGNAQVDGNIILEGSINNVNIADDGEITTTKGVNGADFNGATITATKFNGATIDTSGNVTGAKGTFSGAVTGASFNNFSPYKTLYILTSPSTSNAMNYILPALSMGKSSGQSFMIIGTNSTQRAYIGNNNLLLNTSSNEFGNNTGIINKIVSNVSGLTYKIIVSSNAQVTTTVTITGGISKTITINNTYSGEITLSATEVSNMLATPTYIKSSSTVYANVSVSVIVPTSCLFCV